MENQPPSPSYQSHWIHSRKLLLGGVIVFVLIIGIAGFFVARLALNRKPVQEPIPENAQIVADEVVVKIKEGYTPVADGPQNPKWEGLYGELQKLGVVEYEKVFEATEGELSQFYKLKLKKGSDVVKVRDAVYTLPEIEASDPNPIVEIQAASNDTYYSGMWGLQQIQASQAWDVTKGSNSVTVAVVDTGIDYNHQDFVGRTIIKGPDYNSCTGWGYDSSGRRVCSSPKARDNDPMDDNGHGTHVSGTIGATTNNGVGVAGVNWDVTLLAVKSLGGAAGTGAGDDIVKALEYAANSGAQVINMSLGGQSNCPAQYQAAINAARSNGAVVVVAAGNDDVDAANFTPANCSGVITVGATSITESRAYYSNFGSTVDIAAPGGDKGGGSCGQGNCITSTWPGGYKSIQGTSMATPHVAGVAALVKAVNPGFGPDEIAQCLIESGDPISTDRPIGGRRLNAYKAVNGCSQITSGATIPVASVTTTPGSSPTNTPDSFFVQGKVYDDANRNAQIDSGEGVLSGVKMVLTGPLNRTLTTGTSGDYSFPNLNEGRYVLQAMNGSIPVMEYRFWITNDNPGWVIDIPMPVKPEGSSGDTPSDSPATTITGTPSPTPRKLYSCREKVSTRQIDNKTVQLKYLECTPK